MEKGDCSCNNYHTSGASVRVSSKLAAVQRKYQREGEEAEEEEKEEEGEEEEERV